MADFGALQALRTILLQKDYYSLLYETQKLI